MITSKDIHKVLNTILGKEILKALRYSNNGLSILCVIVLLVGYGYVIKNTPDEPITKIKPNMQMNPARPGATVEAQELSNLLVTHNQSPEMVKCNFSGTYRVTQGSVRSQNGAKCGAFEPRTLKYDNVTAECTQYLDPKQELYLSCKEPSNPVTKCDGIVFVSVAGQRACEYWVTIQRDD